MNALIVDDMELHILVFTKMLTTLGFSVVAVRDGDEAIAKCREDKFDLILMDFHMPTINGAETIYEIRALEGIGEDAHAIIVGASGQPEVGVEAEMLASGADTIIEKPFAIGDLHACLRTYFDIAQIPA